MILTTIDADKPARPVNANEVKKYFVKNTKKKSSIGRKTEKAT